MKRIILLTVALSIALAAPAQQYMTRTGKVTFFSATPLENINAVNNESSFVLDGKTGDVVAQVPIKSFHFEKALMQEHFNENYMESDKFPKAVFKGKLSTNGIDLTKDGSYQSRVSGQLTMHGVTRDVAVPCTITVKGGTVTASAKFNVAPADYNISIPSLVEGKIAKSIAVTVNAMMTAK